MVCLLPAAWLAFHFRSGHWSFSLETFALSGGIPLLIAGLGGLVSARGAAFFGSACVLAAFLGGYMAWSASTPHPDGLLWLGYFFSLPGAAIGTLAAGLIAKKRAATTWPRIALIASAGCLAGLIVNQGGLCATVMHCAF
ncbi:hypothetical protein [Marilutibacter spongiae]|uniref:Uncharacterized protein n=1 Tax=Marilutibacter spongiae TaxID=2025720 RepID=A0A7W3Y539_9GAMM|nr:hypothetical protein [Lysobacter spongiae]MBB1059807.1 hypothetical protein [Lysobacter spongiae]